MKTIYRMKINVDPAIKSSLKNLAKKWNCKTNDAAARAILQAEHQPKPGEINLQKSMDAKLDEVMRYLS
jgi:predicted transcriptional regulator